MTPRALRMMFVLGLSLVLTAFAQAEPWRFVATGDSRSSSYDTQVNTAILGEIANAITNDKPDVLIFTGDLVLIGSVSAFQIWTNAMAPVYRAGIRVLPIRGNHDLGDGWTEVFGPSLPDNGPNNETNFTFSATHRNAIFLGFDNYFSPTHIPQQWINQTLAGNTLPHVFCFSHLPAFKVMHVDCLQDYPAARNTFWSSLAAAGCRAYFCGHDHFYDHARLDDGDGNPDNDAHQYVVGTGGAPLYSQPGVYNGANGAWTPTRIRYEESHGYVLGEVDGATVTLRWKARVSPNVFVEKDVFRYTLYDRHRPWAPEPADKATLTGIRDPFRWKSSADALKFDLYVGTSEAAIAAAHPTAAEYRGQTQTASTNAGPLEYATPYFWRADAILKDGTIVTGRVWRFTTEPRTFPGVLETFETGAFDTFPWISSGDAVWQISSVNPGQGTYCARSASLPAGGSNSLSVTLNVLSGEIRFSRILEATPADTLTLSMDNTPLGVWTGAQAWGQVSLPVPAGRHTFRWTFQCGCATPDGTQNAALDDILFPLIDTDADGMPDAWELRNGSDPRIDNRNADPDGDRLSNLEEYRNNTDPNTRDTDRDGASDYEETVAGTSPTNARSLFKIQRLGLQPPGPAFTWNSITGRTYSVHVTTSMNAGWTHVSNPAFIRLPGSNTNVEYAEPDRSPGSRFYKVDVIKP